MSVGGRGRSSSTSSSRVRPRHPAYVQIQESQIEEEDDDETSQDNSHGIISKQSAARRSFKTCCLTVFKPACLTAVEPIMFFFMFSRYLYLALIELYFYQKFGLKALNNDNSSTEGLLPNHSFCVNSSLLDDVLGNGTNDKVEGETAFVILLTTIPDYVISVLACLTAGPLSDRYGRKLPLLFALIGNTLASTLNVLLVYFDVGFYYFLSTSFLMGITGGFTIIVTVSLAYVADVSSKKSLTYRIGILHATSYISQALSDAVTGQWLKRSGCNFNPMLWLALSSSVLGVIYLIFLKEPFTKEVRMAKFKEKRSTSLFSMFFRGFKIFFSSEYSKWRLWFTMAILGITIFNAIGVFQLLTLFQVHKPLEWGPGLIGWYGLASTLIQAFSIFCVLPIFVYLKVPDSVIVLVALLITSGINVYTGFLKKTWEMFFG